MVLQEHYLIQSTKLARFARPPEDLSPMALRAPIKLQKAYSEQLLFNEKNDLFFEIPSLFSSCSQKMQKSAKRSAQIAKMPFIKSA